MCTEDELYLSKALESLSAYTTPNIRIQLVKDVAQSAIRKFTDPSQESVDLWFILNQAGKALTLASVHKEASLAYNLAFTGENPYHPNTPIYAENLVESVQKHIRALGQEVNPILSERPWLDFLAPSLRRACACIEHFKNYYCYYQGYINHYRQNNGEIAWTDRDVLTRAQSLSLSLDTANDLLRTYNLL